MARKNIFHPLKVLLVFVVLGHVFLCPYTKVEESFNMQALHDLLYLRTNLSNYDHHEFPGVVPRSFIGPLLIALPASPFVLLFQWLHLPKIYSQILVRCILALFTLHSFFRFRSAIRGRFGQRVSDLVIFLVAIQFHLPFYMSRPLPNTFALVFVLRAFASWLSQRPKQMVGWLAFASVVFRSEIVLLAGPMILLELLAKRLSLRTFLAVGTMVTLVSLFLTVLIDSTFWDRWLWPEAEVFYYNTVLNKSSNWGVSPFHWYFSSVLPRAFGAWLVFVPFAFVLKPTIRPFMVAVFSFILIYSLLPHKELRFIMYTFPLINTFVAVACDTLLDKFAKHRFLKWFVQAFIVGCVALSIITTQIGLGASRNNYPGAAALLAVHDIHGNVGSPNSELGPQGSIHIASAAAQSGITRFLETDGYVYSKLEQWNEKETPAMYEWLLTSSVEVAQYADTHCPMFHTAAMSWKLVPRLPFVIVSEGERIEVLRRKQNGVCLGDGDGKEIGDGGEAGKALKEEL